MVVEVVSEVFVADKAPATDRAKILDVVVERSRLLLVVHRDRLLFELRLLNGLLVHQLLLLEVAEGRQKVCYRFRSFERPFCHCQRSYRRCYLGLSYLGHKLSA